MTDVFSPEKRSIVMSRICGKHTKPELAVRSLLHQMGYRFSLHCKELPGKPDIVLPKYDTVIFVNGCFWHRHGRCKYTTTPKTRKAFWNDKFEKNIERDARVRSQLHRLGWYIITIWECQLRNPERLATRLDERLQVNGERISAFR